MATCSVVALLTGALAAASMQPAPFQSNRTAGPGTEGTSPFVDSPNPRCGTWVSTDPNWQGWQLQGASVSNGRLTLPAIPGPLRPAGIPGDSSSFSESPSSRSDIGEHNSRMATTIPNKGCADMRGHAVGPIVEVKYPFENVVPSWNATTPPGSRFAIDLRARIGDRWTRWFGMGHWSGDTGGASIPDQSDADGAVQIDTLVLQRPANALQLRIHLTGSNEASPDVSLAALCWFNPNAPIQPNPVDLVTGQKVLPVPRHSQMLQPGPLADSICSPTSLSMVLGYWGIRRSPMEVAVGVHDSAADIYGNWPFNTAFAASCGMASYVTRFRSLEQLQDQIDMERPVEVSIKFGRGELNGSPLHVSRGHLVVVIGFTPDGDVVVNDPAAPSEESVKRVYQRAEFERAWLTGSGGIAYIIKPWQSPASNLRHHGAPLSGSSESLHGADYSNERGGF